MKETTCPNCGKPITGDMVRSSIIPCQVDCGHCHVKLREYKVSAPIMAVAIAITVLLIYLVQMARTAVMPMFPAARYVPAAIFALVCAYPVFIVSERLIAKLVVTKGHIIYRKR